MLTRQDVPFLWTPLCQEAFQALKDLLTSPPVLAYPCFDKGFAMHTDASGQGLGAVLEQEQSDGKPHPITYASRTLSKAESHYGITELEALSIVWVLRHFRAYIYGSRTVVFTDHAPLRAMLMAKHPSGNLARWAAVIAELDVDIQYRPGRCNANADALSRAPVGEAEEISVAQLTGEEVIDRGPLYRPSQWEAPLRGSGSTC